MKNCLWCCFVVMFFSADALHAQIQDQVVPQSVVGKEVSEPEKPKGIPTIEISSRAQQTRIALNKLRGSLEHVSDILTIQEQLPSLLYSLQRLRSSWLYKSLNSLSTRKLQDIDNEWTIHLEKLNAWEGKLSGRTGELEENNRQLNEMEELWLITREVVVKNEAPEVILERVQSTLDEIKEIKAVYSERIKDLLIYQDKISEQQLEIKKLISLINRAEAQSRKHLFARSSLPLWKAVQADDARLNFVSQIRLSCTGFVLMNMDYIQSNRGRCFLHIIIFAALLAFMIYFYHCNRHNQLFDEKDEIFKISAFLFSCVHSLRFFLFPFFWGHHIYQCPGSFP
ncbi:MAG: hypothetical protein MRJ65_10115 [Candidatus Brocadiaceae bacterium]|nr:hypothetical protein [Candidatus Brocadiaceae bacterium]